jgi:hypothetical protein
MKPRTLFDEPTAVERISPGEEVVAKARAFGAQLILAPESGLFIVDWRSSSIPSGTPAGQKVLLRHYDAILDLLRRERGRS